MENKNTRALECAGRRTALMVVPMKFYETLRNTMMLQYAAVHTALQRDRVRVNTVISTGICSACVRCSIDRAVERRRVSGGPVAYLSNVRFRGAHGGAQPRPGAVEQKLSKPRRFQYTAVGKLVASHRPAERTPRNPSRHSQILISHRMQTQRPRGRPPPYLYINVHTVPCTVVLALRAHRTQGALRGNQGVLLSNHTVYSAAHLVQTFGHTHTQCALWTKTTASPRAQPRGIGGDPASEPCVLGTFGTPRDLNTPRAMYPTENSGARCGGKKPARI